MGTDFDRPSRFEYAFHFWSFGQGQKVARCKARSNFKKDKVSFEEAATAITDPMAATGADPDHSAGEFRYITFGISKRGRLLVVAHTEERDSIRIISARLARKRERNL